MEIAGHAKTETSRRYTHLSPTATVSAIQLMYAGETLETVTAGSAVVERKQ
jgi:hypothetical protein